MKRYPDNRLKSRREFLCRSTVTVGGLLLTPCVIGQVLEPRKNGALPSKRATAAKTLRLGAAHTTEWVKNDTNASIDRDASGNTWEMAGDIITGDNLCFLQHIPEEVRRIDRRRRYR